MLENQSRIHEIIINVVKMCEEDYQKNPLEYLTMEIEAQLRIRNFLDKELKNEKMKLDIPECNPGLINQMVSPVRLEWKIEKNKHDILIFKRDSHWISHIKDLTYDDVEAFIEVKVGWGLPKRPLDHFDIDSVRKDFEHIRNYKQGYFFYFLGNGKEASLEANNSIDYALEVSNLYKEYNIDTEHFHLFLTDATLSGVR